MKLIWICFLSLLLLSCIKPPAPQTKVWIEKQLFDFIALNPEWDDDDETIREQAREKFKVQAVSWTRDDNYLNNMPFQAVKIRDTIIGNYKFILATFSTYQDSSRKKSSLLNDIDLKINAIFRLPEFAENLRLGNRYYLRGRVYKRGKREMVDLLNTNGDKQFKLGLHTFSVEELLPVRSLDRSQSI